MGTACGTYGGERCILGFDGARGKETTWTKHAHENNKMNIQEKGGGGGDWIGPVKYRGFLCTR